MDVVEEIENLLQNGNNYSLPVLLDSLKSIVTKKICTTEAVTADLIDLEFFEDVKNLTAYENIPIYFGKTLRDVKCVILDERLREHPIFISYKGPKKLIIKSVILPHSPLQDREYSTLEEIIFTFKRHVDSLSTYFHELERIDRFCTVMEPAEPTFKDDFRRILLDDRIWLHIEVTPDGLASNVHLVGQSDLWSNRLQQGLLSWDHDKEIIENITTVFDLVNFPADSRKSSTTTISTEDRLMVDPILCGICLCAELPESSAMPLPLCPNLLCGTYFHRNCLFQWLVSSGGGRPPAFGVATGCCPACIEPIACCERDA
ncbi:E3 ubiquitin-protein ligase FANCL [Ostrinia nubilalis]|uniref:E3 ubiquitin-protein ligase FANCL n=1 Tax=Ostrinia nubilalis TaxID=29057 RepID=UPI0030823D87